MKQINQVKTQAEWERFWSKQEPKLFIQSWDYQKFCQKYGDQAIFLTYQPQETSHPIAGSIVIYVHARRGNYFYLPYGPICQANTNKSELLKAITKFLTNPTNNLPSANFIKVSPFWDDNKENLSALKKAKFIKSPLHVLAETTWILPLDKSPDDLMQSMRQNHRNLIRRSQREGIKVIKSKDPKDINVLNQLLQETAHRHNFIPFSKKFIEAEFNAFTPDNATIYLAKDGQEVIAAAMFFHIGDTMVYRHSATKTGKEYNKKAANYAIQWQAINDAHQMGLKYYNFWGIAPETATSKHPFWGITRFKKGFGGYQKDLIPCHDYPINYKYWLNYILEVYRKFKRGF